MVEWLTWLVSEATAYAILTMSTVTGQNTRERVARRQIGPGTINALPCHVLLEIFKFYLDQIYHEDAWHTLLHVCQQWRYIVFASPRWLHLQLRCTNKRPVKKMLDIWPALPIAIYASITNPRQSGVGNLIAALKRHDLVYRIKISHVPHSLLKSSAMKKRFPMLTDLTLRSNEENASIVPDSFLGGSAPRLQSLEFVGIQSRSSALGKLLLSATDLVSCRLWDIPKFGIISPDLIVTALSTSTRLQTLVIGFRFPRSHADRERRHLSLFNRLVLPSLTDFIFKGDSEYLEDILCRIDAPALDRVKITFFNQLVFDTPLLRDFFSRTEVFREPHRAGVTVGTDIRLTLFRLDGTTEHHMLQVTISSWVAEWQLSSLAQFYSSSFPPLPTLERLSIDLSFYQGLNLVRTDDMESSHQWLELLNSFVAVRDLVLKDWWFRAADQVVTALRELTGSTVTEVLPALQRVLVHPFDVERVREALAPFITARGHSVSVHPV